MVSEIYIFVVFDLFMICSKVEVLLVLPDVTDVTIHYQMLPDVTIYYQIFQVLQLYTFCLNSLNGIHGLYKQKHSYTR